MTTIRCSYLLNPIKLASNFPVCSKRNAGKVWQPDAEFTRAYKVSFEDLIYKIGQPDDMTTFE